MKAQIRMALTVAGILSLFAAMATPSLGEPVSYPMTCLAGGNYQFTLNVTDSHITALIRFEKGTSGVGKNFENIAALQPGHCAWLDRGVRGDEPEVIRHTVEEKPFFAFEWTAQGSGVEGHHVRLGNVKVSLSSDLLKHHPFLGALVEAQPGQHSFSVFQVYNDRQGYLVVTKLGL